METVFTTDPARLLIAAAAGIRLPNTLHFLPFWENGVRFFYP